VSNCILFAVMLWWRRHRRPATRGNNYLVIRGSRVRFGLFHMLHGRLDSTGRMRLISYKPHTPEKLDIEIIFKGRVRRGDARKEET
jgi:hypothetical protein